MMRLWLVWTAMATLALSLRAQTHPSTAPTTAKYLITGRVIDATTLKPVEGFTLILRPAKNSLWQNHMLKRYSTGAFQFPHPRGWNDILIRVWADGYKPAVVHVGEDQDEVEVWLKPAQAIRGKVIGLDGKPLAGAQVALAGVGQDVRIEGVKLQTADLSRELDRKIALTNSDGAFELPDDPEAMMVVVVHESGYGEIPLAKVEDPINLVGWAKVQGQLLRGSIPAPGWKIWVHRAAPRNAEPYPFIRHDNEAITDGAGKCFIDHIPPGTNQVSVEFIRREGAGQVHGLTTFIDFKPGEQQTLTLGGEGRPITGRLVSKSADAGGAGAGGKIDWSTRTLRIGPEAPSMSFIVNDPIEKGMREAQQAFFADGLTKLYYHEIKPQADGRFRIDRLPQGSYQIIGVPIAGNRSDFEIKPMPTGKSDEPLDLGDLQVSE